MIALPAGMVTVSLICVTVPPGLVLPVAPPVAMLVKDTLVSVAGKTSVTCAPAAVDGPALVTTIV